jgi:hypothetical protein
MGIDEAEELARFARNLARSELADLVPVIATTLDELIDSFRSMGGGGVGVELAAAVSAELHKRNATIAQRSPMVGTA